MATDIKTPLQAVVSVMCDALADLPPADQERALEATAVTLGLVALGLRKQPPSPRMREALPRVEVRMMGDAPVVMNQAELPPEQARPGRSVIVDAGQPAIRAALPPGSAAGGGYVRPRLR